MNKELVFLRTFAVAMAIGMTFVISTAMKNSGNQKFTEIDVERINIVEKDGTVKMIITNVKRFPTGEIVNGNETHSSREKTAGMLFFNEDGLECGGLIYTGQKNENGHVAAMSLTYDQYDGDQVMQLITVDNQQGDQRKVQSLLVFNDREKDESQAKMLEASKELNELRRKDPQAYEKKLREYREQGMFKSTHRIILGKLENLDNGLFLCDDQGTPRAMFYVDKENNAKLDFLDEKGNIIASFPEKKK
ncbi:MAG: hypothetical protein LBH22_04585 [Bacteroidales bacterium]|jgi:hypothetical protein|nr:hypothetical protein [Bacteroidales bacterium]